MKDLKSNMVIALLLAIVCIGSAAAYVVLEQGDSSDNNAQDSPSEDTDDPEKPSDEEPSDEKDPEQGGTDEPSDDPEKPTEEEPSDEKDDTPVFTVQYNGSAVNGATLHLSVNDASDIVSKLTVTLDGTDVKASSTISGVPDSVSSGDSFTVTVEYDTYKISFDVSVSSDLSFQIGYVSGTENCYTVTYTDDGYTVTFAGIAKKSEYSITGTLVGNIVIDAGEYKFTLDLEGVKITSSSTSPIVILSGDEVTLSAKKGTVNTVTDDREQVTDDSQYSSSIYSVCDLNIQGKGKLIVESTNNNGIHTKDDLNVKNLTLEVTCQDNALKGNDSVTIESGNITLIAKTGDGIKTSNNDTKFNDDGSFKKQKGNVIIDSDEGNTALKIYAACDGIDSAFDVEIFESNGNTVSVEIYTASYSGYSEDVVSESSFYLIVPNKTTYYSVAFSDDNKTVWVTPEYYSTARGGMTTYYVYTVNVPTGYTYFTVYSYGSSASQGSDSGYSAKSDLTAVNTGYNACLATSSNSSITCSWTTLTVGGSPGGGWDEGNTDKLDYSAKGIKADDKITISGGTFLIKSYDDALHANSDNAVEATDTSGNALGYGSGDVCINGGSFTIETKDDGMHADGTLTVSGGTIDIIGCYEGLEGLRIEVSGGNISVVSKDDGFNSTATTGTGMTFSGGYVYVYAGGDGLDSNTKTSYKGFVITGGYIVSICTSSMNSALDTENGYTFTGGYVVAFNPSTGGMSNESTNCSNFSSAGVSKSISTTKGSYVTISGNGETCVIEMPSSSRGIITLGFTNSAEITVTSSSSAELDSNGVNWS